MGNGASEGLLDWDTGALLGGGARGCPLSSLSGEAPH